MHRTFVMDSRKEQRMKKDQKTVVKFNITAEVTFYSTGIERADKKIKTHIKKWLKETLEEESYIPIMIDGEDSDILEGVNNTVSNKVKYTIEEVK